MALPLEQGIPRFKQNEERIDVFANGDDTQSYVSSGGVEVPSVRKWLGERAEIITEIDERTDAYLSIDVPGMRVVSVTKTFGGVALWSDGLRNDMSRIGDIVINANIPGVAFAVFKDPWQFSAAMRHDLTRVGGASADEATTVPPATGNTRSLGTRIMAEQSFYDAPTGPRTCRMWRSFPDGFVDLEFIFSSFQWDGSTPSDPYTTRFSFEFGGTLYPVTFGGADSVLIGREKTVVSDVLKLVGVEGSSGYDVEERTPVGAVGRWGRGTPAVAALGEGVMDGAHARTTPGSRPTINAERMFGPVAVRGRTRRSVPKPSVRLRGSSSYFGTGDTPTAPLWVAGFAARALTELGLSAPNASQAGQTFTAFLAEKEKLVADDARSGATHVQLGLASNDLFALKSLSEMQDMTIEVLDAYGEADLGVILATQSPRVTGTFATKEGQVLGADADTRRDYSAWIRTLSHGALTGYIDVEAAVADPSDVRYWRTDGGIARTGDGTHPNVLGHDETRAAIKPTYKTILKLDAPHYDEFVMLLGSV